MVWLMLFLLIVRLRHGNYNVLAILFNDIIAVILSTRRAGQKDGQQTFPLSINVHILTKTMYTSYVVSINPDISWIYFSLLSSA